MFSIKNAAANSGDKVTLSSPLPALLIFVKKKILTTFLKFFLIYFYSLRGGGRIQRPSLFKGMAPRPFGVALARIL